MSAANAWTIEQLLEHAEWIRRLAHVLVRDPGAAEDLAQETWVHALKSPPKHQGPLKPWLATILRNLVRERARGNERRIRREQSAETPLPVEPVEDLAQRAEAQRLLVEFVLELPQHYRDVVLLNYFEGLSSVEIAERLGVPDVTVRSRLKRGLDQLRERFDRKYGDRKAWIVMLMPLAKRPGNGAGVVDAVDAGASPAVGKGVAVGVALLASVGAWWWFVRPEPRSEPSSVESTRAAEGVVEPSAESTREVRNADDTPATNSAHEVPLGKFAGRLVDASGRPIAGAELVLSRSLLGKANGNDLYLDRYVREELVRLTTDDDGRFEWAGLRGDSFDVEVDVPLHGRMLLQGVSADGEREIALEPESTIAGRVVRAVSGEPVAGALVTASLPAIDEAFRSTTTAGDGSFRLSGLPSGEVLVFAHSPSGAISLAVPELVAGRAHDVDIELQPGILVRGHVVDDATGAPVVGATVRSTLNRSTVVTDADGRFEWGGYQEFELDFLVVRAEGYGTFEARPTVRSGTAEATLDLRLPRGVAVRGAFTDSAGTPLAHARVIAIACQPDPQRPGRSWPSGIPRSEFRETTTDATGAFAFTGLRADVPRALWIVDERVADVAFDVPVPPSGADVVDVGSIQVPAPVVLHGRVVDAHGAPLSRQEVRFAAVSDARVRLTGRKEPWTGYLVEHRTRFSDAEGWFTFPRAAPGAIQLEVRSELGSEFATTELRIDATERSKSVELRDVPRFELAGTVRDEQGTPITDAEIKYARADQPGVAPRRVYTGPDGRYRIRGIEAGSYRLEAWTRIEELATSRVRPAQLVADAGRMDVDFVLRPGHWVDIRVRDAKGSPVHGARVVLEGVAGERPRMMVTPPSGIATLMAPPLHECVVSVFLAVDSPASPPRYVTKHTTGTEGGRTQVDVTLPGE